MTHKQWPAVPNAMLPRYAILIALVGMFLYGLIIGVAVGVKYPCSTYTGALFGVRSIPARCDDTISQAVKPAR